MENKSYIKTNRLKILNLYSGIGGNRKLWGNEHSITAVEINSEVAEVYKKYFPLDNVIVADAHDYLLNHFNEYDFIWSSPPCQSHSRMIISGTNRKKKVYPDMKLYQEIILLKHQFKGKFIVENVRPYYEPLIKPSQIIDRHFYWNNFRIKSFIEPSKKTDLNNMKKNDLIEWLGYKNDIPNIYLEGNHCNIQILRNCVHPGTGLHILNCALNIITHDKVNQVELF